MPKNKVFGLSLILLLMTACIFNTTTGTPAPRAGGTATAGSADFSAQATSPQSVMLTWKAVDGAIGYILEFGWNGQDFYPMADVPAGQTQYEDFTALPGSTESYRIQAVTDAGPADWLRADATTPAAAPSPLAVQPTYDIESAVSATIGAAGGSVSLTDAGGVTYKLDLPADALAADTEVQLVPLTALEGWPLDGERLAAVRIEPAGLQLAELGTLTITGASAGSPDLSTVGFALQPTGDEFHLAALAPAPSEASNLPGRTGHLAAPARQSGSAITLWFIDLTVLGVGQGSTSAIGDLARSHAPTDAGAAVEQQQAAAGAVVDDLGSLPNLHGQESSAHDAERRLEGEMGKIQDTVRTAVDGDGLVEAMTQFQKWQNQAHMSPDEYNAQVGPFWEDITAKFKKLLDKAAEDCKRSTGAPPPPGVGPLQRILQTVMNPPTRGGEWSVFQDKMTTAFGDNVLTQAWSDLRKGVCGPYRVTNTIGYNASMICSLARPFTVTSNISGSRVFSFIPQVLSHGIVHVVHRVDANGAFEDGLGTYHVEFSTQGEAFLVYNYTGIMYIPHMGGLPDIGGRDQIKIKQSTDPTCP